MKSPSLLIMAVFPVIYLLGDTNNAGTNLVMLLQENNIAANTTGDLDCAYLKNAVQSWLRGSSAEHSSFDIYSASRNDDVFVLWAQLLPVRCAWQSEYPYREEDGVITHCRLQLLRNYEPCKVWRATSPETPEEATAEYFADTMGIRVGGIRDMELRNYSIPAIFNGSLSNETFHVRVIYDENSTLSFA